MDLPVPQIMEAIVGCCAVGPSCATSREKEIVEQLVDMADPSGGIVDVLVPQIQDLVVEVARRRVATVTLHNNNFQVTCERTTDATEYWSDSSGAPTCFALVGKWSALLSP